MTVSSFLSPSGAMSSELNVPMGSPAPGAPEQAPESRGMDYRDWVRRSYLELVSSNHHSVQALSWRKLYLSRAKLKASSRTSALLSGFAMVSQLSVTRPTHVQMYRCADVLPSPPTVMKLGYTLLVHTSKYV